MSLVSKGVAFVSQRFPKLSSRVLASSGYTLDPGRFGDDAHRPWDDRTAERMDRAWKPIVAAAKDGRPREDVAALWTALDDIPLTGGTLLEVGCGGGYNSELVLERRPAMRYTGLDLSESMVALARSNYPGRSFVVGSAYELPYPGDGFDIVMDGVALLHMHEWPRAIGEYARVASQWVILHGLTLTERPTTEFGKYAYGQPSIELVQNRGDVERTCADAGLTIVARHENLEYDLGPYLGIPSTSETWVLRV